MASLGQELRRERELRAITLREIANITKISIRYLQALEEDRLDVLPGTFFIKGAIRAYAKAIGLDEDHYMNKYHEDVLLQTYAVDKDRKRAEPGQGWPITSHSRLYLIVFVSVLAIAALAYLFLLKPHTSKRALSAQSPAPPAQVPVIVTPPPPRRLESVLPAQTAPLKLDLSFTADTWIQVFADGKLKIDGIKRAGETAGCEAQKEFLIHTGNAGGVALTINGKPGKPLGGQGIVLTDIKITPENYGEFLRPAEKAKET
jgi:cytoskeleton protein RodZ